MRIKNLYPGSWGSNCFLLINGTHAAIVDPSACAERILDEVKTEGAQLEAILLTHGHFDHTVSMDTLREKTGIPAMIHEKDAELPSDSRKNGFYTFFQMERAHRAPDRTFADGDVLMLGDEEIRVIHTPGHTEGSVCFLCNRELLLTGDTLFDGNVGRTDLYGGDEVKLYASLKRLRGLDKDLTIYPGHGAPSTLGLALDLVID